MCQVSNSSKGREALIVVDLQNDFLPGGALEVPDALAIIPVIKHLMGSFDNVVLTQDWHPVDHISFACNHDGAVPFETIELSYGQQTLWPAHCVQNSHGSAITELLGDIESEYLLLRKGFRRHIDSYSAFMEGDRKTDTGLAHSLREKGIERVFVCGLATDFCVAWTAIDAKQYGFDVSVIEDACRGVNIDGSLELAWQEMQQAGIERISSDQLGSSTGFDLLPPAKPL